MTKPLAVIVVRRQLSTLRTGANVYLSLLLDELRRAEFSVHLVFAPESSFGNRPVATIGADFLNRCDRVSWSGALRLGRVFLSLSPRVYGWFLRRVCHEIACRVSIIAAPLRLGRVSEPLDTGEARRTAAVVNALSPNLVVAEYSALGPVLQHISTPGTQKAVLLHDLFSLRAHAMRGLELPVDFADFTLEEEAALCAGADMLIYASQSEREVFRKLLPDCQHIWLSPRCDPGAGIPPSGHPKALFMGVRHGGNLDALEFLMEEIWPKVIARKADAELWIVGEIGASLRPEWRRMPGVKVLGIVEDLKPLGGPDTIGLAPTRVASGVSIKIADYLNLGMAVVTSRIALEGYGDGLDTWVETADGTGDFADRLTSLLKATDRRHALASKVHGSTLVLSGNEELKNCLREIAEYLP